MTTKRVNRVSSICCSCSGPQVADRDHCYGCTKEVVVGVTRTYTAAMQERAATEPRRRQPDIGLSLPIPVRSR